MIPLHCTVGMHCFLHRMEQFTSLHLLLSVLDFMLSCTILCYKLLLLGLHCTVMHSLNCTIMHCLLERMVQHFLHCHVRYVLLYTTLLVLHCTELHALQCTVMHCNALQRTALWCTVMHCNELHCDALHASVKWTDSSPDDGSSLL